LAHHATPPAEAEIFGVRITDRPPAMATPLNEPREGDVKAGWPGLGLHDNHMRNVALGREGHVILSSYIRQAKENRVAKEERHPARPAASIIIS
jgi:hypothetical protein